MGLTVSLSALVLLAWSAPGADQESGTRPGAPGRDPSEHLPGQGAATSPPAEVAEGSTERPLAAPPTRLVIKAIDLDEPVRALGLTEAGEIEPPPGVVQWYTGSVVPGHRGHSVIAGHVTSPRPDVFHRLAELGAGDRVAVTDRSGDQRVFVVDETERVDKHALTADPRVWGETRRRVLVLITCDRDSPVSDGHHRGNVVVWAFPATD